MTVRRHHTAAPAGEALVPEPPDPELTPQPDEGVIEVPSRSPVWPVVVSLGALALVLTVPNQWGWLANDNRFVFFEAPATQLRGFLTPWSSSIDLGGTPPGFSPVVFAYAALLRSLGLPAWLVQRLFHATLLALLGIGTALLARRLDRRSPGLPMLAGVLAMTAAFTMAFLTPSWLFLNAALTPWLILSLLIGTSGSSRWRGPALFAAGVATAGSLNLPGLFWAAVPVVPFAAYLVYSRACSLRRMLAWGVRAGALSTMVLLPALVRARLGAQSLLDNLGSTETLSAVSQSSSWSESLRGLGSWILYWNPSGQLLLGHLEQYLGSVAVVLLTFLPVVAAFAVVGLSRWRPRLPLGMVLLVSAAAMVGAFPFANPSPAGSLLVDLYSAAPPLFGLRNTYKAGAGVVLATAVLAAQGIVIAARRLFRTRRPRLAVGALGVGLVIAMLSMAWPLVSGGSYRDRPGTEAVPDYWRAATTWLDEQPDDQRVAIYPGSVGATYEWGTVGGGDLFPALLDRPYLLSTPLSTGPADAANLVRSLDDYVTSGTYVDGTYAPIARRIGVGYVLIRNDMNWHDTSVPRPATMDALRQDPDLQLVATFGDPGQNVVRPGETGTAATLESGLPPVEIYRVRGAVDPVRAVDSGPSLLVSGDGAAWPQLSARGDLASWVPVQYTGRVTADEIIELLDAGSSVTVTDTNRRVRSSYAGGETPLLTADDARGAGGPFTRGGTQSVAWFGDATSIEAIRSPNLVNPGVANRPTAAFDGNPDTAWRTGAALPLVGQSLEVQLARPATFDSMTITPASVRPGDRQVLEVQVSLPDGTTRQASVARGTATVDLGGAVADSFVIEVTSIAGESMGPFGLAEIAVEGVDLQEWVQAPTDLAQAADSDPDTAAALASAPVSYLFRRQTGIVTDDESALARRFRGLSPAPYAISGTLNAEASAGDLLLASLLPGAVQSYASGRYQNALSSSGVYATDGDETTEWRTVPGAGDRLGVSFPGQESDVIDLVVDATGMTTPLTVTATTSAANQAAAVLSPDQDCEDTATACLLRTTVQLPEPTESVVLTVDGGNGGGAPVGIAEVLVEGQPNQPLPDLVVTECRDDLLELDGRPLPVRVLGTTDQLMSGGQLSFAACDAVTLSRDWNSLRSGWELPADDVQILPSNGSETPEVDRVPADPGRDDDRSLTVDLPEGGPARVVSGRAADPRWAAGRDATFVELDTQASWVVPPGTTTLTATYGPTRLYQATLLVYGGALVLVLGLLILDPRRRGAEPPRRGLPPAWWVDVTLVAFATIISGVIGAVISLLAVMALRQRLLDRRILGLTATVLVALAAFATVPPLGPSLTPISPTWPVVRSTAHALARLAAVVLASAIAAALRRPPRLTAAPTNDEPPLGERE